MRARFLIFLAVETAEFINYGYHLWQYEYYTRNENYFMKSKAQLSFWSKHGATEVHEKPLELRNCLCVVLCKVKPI